MCGRISCSNRNGGIKGIKGEKSDGFFLAPLKFVLIFFSSLASSLSETYLSIKIICASKIPPSEVPTLERAIHSEKPRVRTILYYKCSQGHQKNKMNIFCRYLYLLTNFLKNIPIKSISMLLHLTVRLKTIKVFFKFFYSKFPSIASQLDR